ncbi:hypothetical protein [Plantactinospora sp. KBS50]|uniref:hypothetical protein n=1 Tax=Plantactinospora sp. KBS50 TaxID=2024580 RepID=UPI000BAB10DF|nr:hypothetical protein [Plantactinospora sp. KBS50]ASW57999.1 hypothetical protein CIK06_25255 [Plantactinospora sp. KBS50]
MATFQYALLVRRRLASTTEAGWEITFHWYGPDGSTADVTEYGDTAVAHLNRLGAQGWELVTMTEDHSMDAPNELHRYHLKRLVSAPAPRPRLGRAGRMSRTGR